MDLKLKHWSVNNLRLFIRQTLDIHNGFRLPVNLQVKLGIWLVLVARSYRKLNEKTLETPMKSADNWPVGKRKEAGLASGRAVSWSDENQRQQRRRPRLGNHFH